jgi:hypothetical protein
VTRHPPAMTPSQPNSLEGSDSISIPRVVCQVGEFNQPLLNIVVNAAHAIGEVVAGTDSRAGAEESPSAARYEPPAQGRRQ